MTTKADYTAEEWELLRKTPLIMAAAVIVSDLSGSVGVAREFLSMAQAVEETAQRHDTNELVAALVADLQTPQGEHAEETEDITDIAEARAKTLAETREIAALLARKAPPAEAEGFKPGCSPSPSESPRRRVRAACWASARSWSARKRRR
jgi:hypothetical protein